MKRKKEFLMAIKYIDTSDIESPLSSEIRMNLGNDSMNEN
jgi:hypothetical protein